MFSHCFILYYIMFHLVGHDTVWKHDKIHPLIRMYRLIDLTENMNMVILNKNGVAGSSVAFYPEPFRYHEFVVDWNKLVTASS